MSEDWKPKSREAVNEVVSLAQYRQRKYRSGLSEENKNELEKARKKIIQDKDDSGNKGGNE